MSDTRFSWIGWAIGAVVLVLLLAWLLSRCGDEEAAALLAVTGSGPGFAVMASL